jgi:hypothetical protein
MAGHSLGGTCASFYTQANPETVIANIIYGSYVTDQRVDTWEVPVLTIGAELDGGLGRPGNLLTSIDYSDAAAKDNGGVYSDWQMEQKPVVILPGMDHSDFCPGFQVPGDVYPSDITDQTVSNNLIGQYSSSFLHLHTTQTDEAKVASRFALKL